MPLGKSGTSPIRNGLLIVLLAIGLAFAPIHALPAQALTCTFKNPMLTLGQDPSVVYQGGFYYLVQSDALGLTIRKSETLTGLSGAPEVTIFAPPPNQPYSFDLWAPELVYLDGGWYIYFAADDAPGHNQMHRIYALKADTADPQGTWSFKGKPYQDAATDLWAIDATVFPYKGKLYIAWSGAPTSSEGGTAFDSPQSLFIAEMSDPLTVRGARHLITTPDQNWERSVRPIEEGPEPFIHNDQLSLVYSADASWTHAYKLGLLKLSGLDPLAAQSWSKVGPIFQEYQDANGAVYGPGHNSAPVPSPDGTQSWLVYHSKAKASDGWDDRDVRTQAFTWNADNTPNLGHPIPAGVALPLPSGEPCGLTSEWTLNQSAADNRGSVAALNGSPTWTSGLNGAALQFNGSTDYLDLNQPILNTMGSYSVAAWVQLDRTDKTLAIASQEGGIASAFILQYNVEAGNVFAFTLLSGQGKLVARAVSSFSPSVGSWYHLVGVRDGLNNQIRLYVNGKLEGTSDAQVDWKSLAHAMIGAARLASKRVQFFSGKLDDVRFYSGALDDRDVADLYQQVRPPTF